MHRDRQANRPDNSAEYAGAGGSGHQMTFWILDCRFSIKGEEHD
jgi:hypothetical protein